MLYSVYEISKSGYGVRVREKTCVIAQNLRGQVLFLDSFYEDVAMTRSAL